ncbi:hypothetical protein [Streptomyces sp. ME19-01-6]|uniref:hypothetical protein n=1 Tax=Streptomyces sp. ME19-01-6 TaxID=3028686 RepID=UPI0029B8C5A1|nr:hypothetical protein [Streptomyces sp. ME19-01-6]MDX3231359.1 hypothetical protein [Streptomyces sp. ME19-01-6]
MRNLLPRRRPRISARIVKCGISRYHTWNRDGRPTSSVPVIDITPTRPPCSPPPHRQRPHQPPRPLDTGITVLVPDPGRAWHLQELAAALGLTGMKIKSLSNQLARWTAPASWPAPPQHLQDRAPMP